MTASTRGICYNRKYECAEKAAGFSLKLAQNLYLAHKVAEIAPPIYGARTCVGDHGHWGGYVLRWNFEGYVIMKRLLVGR